VHACSKRSQIVTSCHNSSQQVKSGGSLSFVTTDGDLKLASSSFERHRSALQVMQGQHN